MIFLNFYAMSFQKFVNMTKNKPFSPILHVLHPQMFYAGTLCSPEKQS